MAIVWTSAAIPIAIVASAEVLEFVLGSMVPSVLGGLAACAAGWLQFVRPYDGWRLFRQYQRCAERERFLYENGFEPYNAKSASANYERLGLCLIELESRLEPEWERLLPEDAGVAGTAARR
jgi:hypothetical protein